MKRIAFILGLLLVSGEAGAQQVIQNGSGSGSGITALTGDVTASGSGSVASTVTKIQGTSVSGTSGTGNVLFSTSPTASGLTVTGSLTATGLVTNADLANSATTVNGQTCTLGGTCTVTATGGVSSFTGDGVLINNSASTGAVTDTLVNAPANTVLGNNTGSSTAPAYQTSINVSGTVTAASHIPTSATAPTNGMYLPAANTVGISSNSVQQETLAATASSSVNTAVATQAAGIYLPFSTNAGRTVGTIVTGTNIPVADQVLSFDAGTSVSMPTVAKSIASGIQWIPVSSTTGVLANQLLMDPTTSGVIPNNSIVVSATSGAGTTISTSAATPSGSALTFTSGGTGCATSMLIFDNTTPGAIPAGTVVTTSSATTVNTSLTVTGVGSGDSIQCYPTIKSSANTTGTGVVLGDTIAAYPTVILTQPSTSTIANGATITFNANSATAANNNVTVQGTELVTGNLNVGGGVTFSIENGVAGVLSIPLTDATSLEIGTQNLVGLTTGTGNTTVGYRAGKADTTGIQNAAFGANALLTNIASGGNAAFGFDALESTTGAGNTAAGSQALWYDTTGAQNTGLGLGACFTVSTGSNNVCLGYEAGDGTLATGSRNILIGVDSTTTTLASGSVNTMNIGNTIYGSNMLNGTNTGVAGLVGIDTGATAPAAQLQISGSPSATSWTTTGLAFAGSSATLTDTSGSGTIAGPRAAYSWAAPAFAASSSETVTTGATLYIAGPPTNGTNVTITNPFSLWVATGNMELASGTETIASNSATALTVGANGATNPVLTVEDDVSSVATGVNIKGAATGGTTSLLATDSGSNTGILVESKGTGTAALETPSTGTVQLVAGGLGTVAESINSVTVSSQTSSGLTYTPSATTTSTIHWLMTPPADTTLAASTEIPDFKMNGAANTRQHATGALTTQSDTLFTGATQSFVGASTMTDDAAVRIAPAVACGTNGTCTNIESLLIQTQALTGTVTNGYGISVAAPSGATHNFAMNLVGDVQFSGTAPTITSCGSGALATGSTDHKGQITGVSSATACTITFGAALGTAPACTIMGSAALVAPLISSISTAAVTFGFTSYSGTLYYQCF